jgi:hypothetical protein
MDGWHSASFTETLRIQVFTLRYRRNLFSSAPPPVGWMQAVDAANLQDSNDGGRRSTLPTSSLSNHVNATEYSVTMYGNACMHPAMIEASDAARAYTTCKLCHKSIAVSVRSTPSPKHIEDGSTHFQSILRTVLRTTQVVVVQAQVAV